MKKFLTLIILFSSFNAAKAATQISARSLMGRTEVYGGPAFVESLGSLYGANRNSSLMLGLKLQDNFQGDPIGMKGFIDFSFWNTRGTYNGDSYIFTYDKSLSVMGTDLSFNIGGVVGTKLALYGGIGLSLMQLSQSDEKSHEQYGSYVYQGSAYYSLNEKLKVGFKTSWRQIDKTANDRNRYNSFWLNSLILSYAFDWLNPE